MSEINEHGFSFQVQQRQMQINIMRELNPLERDVIAEVRRSLKVEETPLFAQAIMMMRPMDDEVSKLLVHNLGKYFSNFQQ